MNEGMDRTHNPEFTVMEIYVAYKDYNWMMSFTEEIVKKAALDLHGKTDIVYGDKKINLNPPFKRISMTDAIRENTGYDISGMNEEELRKLCDKLNVPQTPEMGKGKLIDSIFGEKCEHTYIQPTFIIDYPVETSPLTKMHRSKPGLVERFELMINGKEIANAYSELNDPVDQLERFQDQLRLSEKGDDEAMFIDMDFVKALEYGMPPTSGMGIGIDRLTMLLTDQPSIQDVLLFPQMKPLVPKPVTESKKEEYIEAGIPEEWIEPLKKLGFTTISKLMEVEKAGKLANDLNGYNKKNKLGLAGLSPQTVEGWLKK
jgi:lysyl-tRNA synthetase class 2